MSSDFRMGPGIQYAWAEVRIQTSHSYEIPAGNCLTIRLKAGLEIAGRRLALELGQRGRGR